MNKPSFALQVLLLIAPSAVFCQTPAILSVVNFARRDQRLSPGGLAELRYRASSFHAGSDTVRVAGQPAYVSDEDDGESLVIQIPAGLPIGPADVVLETSAGASQPVRITLDAYAPGIFPPTSSPYFAWEQAPFGCNHTAAAGDVLSLFAVGLGKADVKPVITVGGKPVEITEFSSDTLSGLGFLPAGAAYRLRFAVPPGDGLHAVTLTINGRQSNAVALPVGKTMLNLSAPSFRQVQTVAADSILTAYACNRGDFGSRQDVSWGTLPDLPTSLEGLSIKVKDSEGVERLAPLYGLNWSQVNYVVPPGTAAGMAAATLGLGDRVIAEVDLQIEAVAPDFFQQAQVIRLRNGVQTVEPGPVIDMGPETDQVYLVAYGTGLRHRTALANVTAAVGGTAVPVEYAGPQIGLPGLDQVNLRLPRTLAGRGGTMLDITVDGKTVSIPVSFR